MQQLGHLPNARTRAYPDMRGREELDEAIHTQIHVSSPAEEHASCSAPRLLLPAKLDDWRAQL